METETLKTSSGPAAAPQPPPSAPPEDEQRIAEPSMLAVITLVLWLITLAIGLIGLLLSRPRAQPPPKPPEVVQADLITTEITPELTQAVEETSPQQIAPEMTEEPPAPPLPAVAAPSPMIAFAQPVEGPVRIVSAREAAPTVAPPVVRTVKRLNYGEGEGIQSAPDYPPQAVLEHQEGAVGVRFTVAPDGHVMSAEVATPSRWLLLNQAALQVVRDRWHFSSGDVRSYEVSIRFHLNQL
jgi:protein TonB